jgi:hypothetical protein
MNRVAINNQEHLPSNLPHQPMQKLHEHLGHESLAEHHEAQLAAVRDRRDHVAPEPFPRAGDHRCLTATPVRPTCRVIAAHTHLITPMNLGLFPLGATANHRILLFQPALYRQLILLECPPDRLLRRQTPPLQIATHRPHRQLNAELPANQVRHRLPRPQVEWQMQLIRTTLRYRPNYLRRLQRLQPTRTNRPTTTPGFQRPMPAFPILVHPIVDRLARHTEYPGRFGLRHALTNRSHRLDPHILLSFRRQRSCILASHTSSIAQYY